MRHALVLLAFVMVLVVLVHFGANWFFILAAQYNEEQNRKICIKVKVTEIISIDFYEVVVNTTGGKFKLSTRTVGVGDYVCAN